MESSSSESEKHTDSQAAEQPESENDVVVETLRRFFPGLEIVQNEDEIIVQ